MSQTDIASPLPWVKLQTKLVHHLQLPTVPIGERGVFMYLLMLGGLSSTRGVILGDDVAVARVIGVTKGLVTKAIDRLSEPPFEMLRRVTGGVEIMSWDKYQMPRDQMSRPQRSAIERDGSKDGRTLALGMARQRQRQDGEEDQTETGGASSRAGTREGSEYELAMLHGCEEILTGSRYSRAVLLDVIRRYPGDAVVQGCRDLIEKIGPIKAESKARELLESFIEQAGPSRPRERDRTPEEIRAALRIHPSVDEQLADLRHKGRPKGESCGHDDCMRCGVPYLAPVMASPPSFG